MDSLIVLGASARAAAYSALRAGFAPYAIDLFADLDLAAICPAIKIARYPGEFLPALATAPAAPWIYTGGLENHPRLVDRLARLRPLWGNSGRALRLVRDPRQLARIVEAAELPFPEIRTTSKDGPRSGQWLVKPRRGSGGLGIRWATASDWLRCPRGTYLQQYMEGEAASAVFVAAGGQARFIGATRQLLGGDLGVDPPFLYAGSLGPLDLNDTEVERLQRLGDVLVTAFDLAGLFNVDFVRNHDGIWTIEVNPRYSASIEVLEHALDLPGLKLHAAACRGEPIIDSWAVKRPASQVVGKAVVYADSHATVSAHFDALVAAWNQPGDWPQIADLPRTGDQIAAGQPVATVFTAGDSQQTVLHDLRTRIAAVHATLAPLTPAP